MWGCFPRWIWVLPLLAGLESGRVWQSRQKPLESDGTRETVVLQAVRRQALEKGSVWRALCPQVCPPARRDLPTTGTAMGFLGPEGASGRAQQWGGGSQAEKGLPGAGSRPLVVDDCWWREHGHPRAQSLRLQPPA